MAVPDNRQIIFSSRVVPKKEYATTDTGYVREEGSGVGRESYDKYLLNTTVGKTFGGSGIVETTAEQSMDGWTSFLSPIDNQWDNVDNVWNLDETVWDGELSVTSATVIRSGTDAIKFLYVKNTGTTNDVTMSLDGSTDRYILIPPGGAISLRLKSSVVNSNEILVQSTGSTIEYVIAK